MVGGIPCHEIFSLLDKITAQVTTVLCSIKRQIRKKNEVFSGLGLNEYIGPLPTAPTSDGRVNKI